MEEAQALADEAAVLNRGEIIALGPPAALAAREQTVIRFRLADPAAFTPLAVPGCVPSRARRAAGSCALRGLRPTYTR